jgi:flagellar biosynthesis/type III secretory pathway chaperone
LEPEKTENFYILELIQVLDQLIGHHRSLLECCRDEKTALAEANLKGIQEKTLAKEFLIETIRNLDRKRVEFCGEISYFLSEKNAEISLSKIILHAENAFPEESLKLRSQMNALIHLVTSIQKMNDQNREFLKVSVGHIEEMKKNVLGEAAPKSDVYGNKATVQNGKSQNSRLISKEV